MSIPLFPSLRPSISSPFWLDVDAPLDEEAELLELEQSQRDWKENFGRVFSNILPIGKTNHGADDEDPDDLADDEDDTTSSDDLEDDDAADMFQLPDTQAAAEAPSRPDAQTVNEADSVTHIHARLSHTVVGRLVAASRAGTSLQGTRAAFIDTSGRPIHSSRTSAGSVSPTSRAYIHAALHSPTGPVHIDIPDGEDGIDNERNSTDSHQSQQSLHPSESSTQIDNLIETMQQAQRAAAVPAEQDSTLTDVGASRLDTQVEEELQR